jgi:cytochrome c biogenesis protein CcmG, thiol:disulfide interchange protein DsbE
MLATSPAFCAALEKGNPAPSLLATVSSEQSKALQGKVLYIDFWASWCPPCKESLPWIAELKNKVNNPNFEVITINVDEHKDDALKMVKDLGITSLKVFYDAEGKLAESFGVSTMPSSFIVDEKGTIQAHFRGFDDSEKSVVIATLSSLLSH